MSASPARTPSAAPSPTATSSSTTRRRACATRRSRTWPRPRSARAPQQPALGVCLPRLRVRLLGRLAGQPDPLGGAVRRLRQLGPGDHRQLHRLGRGEVGPDLTPHPAAPARLRGRRARALERPDRAVHPARRRGQHPARESLDRGPVLPPAAPPGPHPEGEADGRLHAEGPAAPAARDLDPRGPHLRAPSSSSSTTRGPRTARARSSGSSSAAARSTTTSTRLPSARRPRTSRSPAPSSSTRSPRSSSPS